MAPGAVVSWQDEPAARVVLAPPPESDPHRLDGGECNCWDCRAREVAGHGLPRRAVPTSAGMRRNGLTEIRPEPRQALQLRNFKWQAQVEEWEARDRRTRAWEEGFLLKPPPLRRPGL